MKLRRNRGFVGRIIVLGLAGLIFFIWYTLNFRPPADTPQMAGLRLIKARPVQTAAKVVHPWDPTATRGRGASTPQSKYIFQAGDREYSGWFEAPAGITGVTITYCKDNPALHCVGSPDQYLSKSSDGFSLGFVVGTGLAFGLGLPLLLVGLKG